MRPAFEMGPASQRRECEVCHDVALCYKDRESDPWLCWQHYRERKLLMTKPETLRYVQERML